MPKTVTRYRQIRRKVDPETGTVATVERVTIARGNVSEQARENRSAAGRANLEHWKERQQSVETVLRATVAEFEKGFDTGNPPSPTERILIQSAVASYSALCLCVEKLKARNTFERTLKLTARLTSLQRGLLKTVNSIDAMRAASGGGLSDRPPAGATEEQRRAWSKKYVDSLLDNADEKKPPQ